MCSIIVIIVSICLFVFKSCQEGPNVADGSSTPLFPYPFHLSEARGPRGRNVESDDESFVVSVSVALLCERLSFLSHGCVGLE